MKRLIVLLALAPAATLAHGGHPPVPEASHGWLHVAIPLAIVALAGWLAWSGRTRDDG